MKFGVMIIKTTPITEISFPCHIAAERPQISLAVFLRIFVKQALLQLLFWGFWNLESIFKFNPKKQYCQC